MLLTFSREDLLSKDLLSLVSLYLVLSILQTKVLSVLKTHLKTIKTKTYQFCFHVKSETLYLSLNCYSLVLKKINNIAKNG